MTASIGKNHILTPPTEIEAIDPPQPLDPLDAFTHSPSFEELEFTQEAQLIHPHGSFQNEYHHNLNLADTASGEWYFIDNSGVKTGN